MIDLHCHSYFSDGALSPEALLKKALAEKIQLLALTDHDTVDGLFDLHKAAHHQPIKIINGIELSARWRKHDIHVIGLNIVLENDSLNALIVRQNESRINRAIQIAAQLKHCGVEDAYAKACKIAGHQRVGRPHFAQVLVNEGVVADQQIAFKRFLVRGRIAYVPTPWISMEEAIQGIIAAQGQPVLAHPLKYKLTRTKLYELTHDFKEAGGVGIEVISGEISAFQLKEAIELCSHFKLLASTGSDYHKDNTSQPMLGRQRSLPFQCTPIWEQWTI